MTNLSQFYSHFIFPFLADCALTHSRFSIHRGPLLKELHGKVLEIGFGAAGNLPFYPADLDSLTALEPNPGMRKKAKKKIATCPFPLFLLNGVCEQIPSNSNSFDFVVSTWTLCSVSNIRQCLAEIYRVLKPEGKFVFLEHGRCKNKRLARWQNFLNPLQKVIGDGCHLNRNFHDLIAESEFKKVHIETSFMKGGVPKIFGFIYKGEASK